MISTRKLKQMAKRWPRAAGVGRKRISYRRKDGQASSVSGNVAPAGRGHFVVYTNDEKRFVVPLAWLRSDIFVELFRMAEDEFGLPGDGPITLPCDALFMENIVTLFRRHASKDLEGAILSSMASRRCLAPSSSLLGAQNNNQLLVCGI